MSAAPRLPTSFSLSGLRMTAREYFAIGETPERYELIDGVVVMSPSPTFEHQKVLRLILRQLEAAVDHLPGVEIVLDTDVKFSRQNVYRPDIGVFGPRRLAGNSEYPDVAPDLIIEILSPSSQARDLITKRDDYARFGVKEYWVIDPASATAKVFRLIGKSRKFRRAATMRGKIESAALAGVQIDLKAVVRAVV